MEEIKEGIRFSPETISYFEEKAKADEAFDKLEKRNMLRKSLHAACINSNIPERYCDSGFSAYETTTSRQTEFKTEMTTVYETLKNGGTVNAVLCGIYGIGKTHLSCAVLRALLQHYSISYGDDIPPFYKTNLCRYARADEILEEYTEAKKYKSNKTQMDVIDYWSKIKYLVIDEIAGTEEGKASKDLLYKILHNRYENGTSTILITNLSFVQLCEYLGGAITDRLREKSKIINCAGISSYRKTN